MPNYIQNRVYMDPESDLTKKFMSIIDKLQVAESEHTPRIEEEGLFFTFVPRPKNKNTDWYNWNVRNWGTKWDAFNIDYEMDDNGYLCVSFWTAWSFPYAFWEAMAKLYPHEYIFGDWADEDMGNNTGYFHMDESGLDYEYIEDENEAMEHAIKVWREESEFDFVNGEWVRKEW